MKTAKRVLAVIVAVIMIVGTCAVAASAATTLQAKIDAASAGDTVTLNAAYTIETVTVNKDITIDLNGGVLRGADGKAAIKVTGGNVTVTNGQVMAFFGKMSTLDMIKTVNDHCPPAISMTGGSLTLDGVRVIGGTIRVPTTPIDDPMLVPAGSGIMSYNGATVTLKRTSIYGDYGVNNKVRAGTPGGTVTVEDAIILAYNTAIKGDYVVADGSEEIIAADRIEGVLNGGIRLTDSEKEVIANALNDRTLIVSKTAETLAAEYAATLEENEGKTPADDDYVSPLTPVITKIEGADMAEIDAPTLDYSWKNNKGTDCSYRLVPESIKLVDGTVVALDPDVTNEVEADMVNEDSQVRYRVQYFIGAEAYPYIISLTKEGLENPLDGVLAWAGEELNTYYNAYTAKNNTSDIDTYGDVIAELGDLLKTIDSLGGKTLQEALGLTNEEAAAASQEGQTFVKDLEVYQQLQRKLYRLAGETGFNAKYPGEYTWNGETTWSNIFGNEPYPEDGVIGTLDRIQSLKDGLEEILGPNLFKNTDAYPDLAGWVIDTAYPELLVTLDEVIERLTDLKNFLTEGDMAKLVAFAHIDEQVDLLDKGLEYANKLDEMLDKALANGDVQATISYLQDHQEEIETHVATAVRVINNWRDYITPEKFLVKDEVSGEYAYVKTYSTLGPVKIEEIIGEGNLHITVMGRGTATVKALSTTNVTDEATLPFEHTFTLTATPKTNYEFLFWVNKEGGGNGRILSTEATFTMNTDLDRDIEAVFNNVNAPVAYFTNQTGDIAFTADVSSGIADIDATVRPYIAGFGFVGWPNADGSRVDFSAATTDYASGNSAFASLNDYYGEEGAMLRVNPNSTSFIVTPIFSKNGGYVATFIDGDLIWAGEGNYMDIAENTAVNGDYWVIDGTDTVMCVNKTFPYQMIDNLTFRSVAGSCPETVSRTTTRVENGSVVFYIERSTKKAIKQVGMVYSASNQNPSFGQPGCYLTTAKFTTQTGLFAPSIKLSNIPAGGVLYGVPYIEFTDGTYYEGDVFQYPQN